MRLWLPNRCSKLRARGIWSKRDTQVHPVTMFGCVSIFFRAINGSINQVQTGHLIRGRGRLNSRLVSCASPRNLLNVSNHTYVIFWPHSSYYTAWCWWCDRSKCPVNQFLPQIWVSSRKPSSSSPPHRSWMMWLFKSKQPQPLKHSNFTFDSSLQSESQYILVVTVLRKKGGEVRREPLVWLTSPLEVRAGQHLTRYCALVGPPFVSAATATWPSARRAANRDRIGQTERNDTNLNLGTAAMLTAELLPPQSWSAIALVSFASCIVIRVVNFEDLPDQRFPVNCR